MRWMPLAVASLLAAVALAGVFGGLALPVPTWLLWLVAVPAVAVALNEVMGKPVPFLRWSFLRMLVGMGTLLKDWQVGDGREQRVVDYVLEKARPGDIDDAIRVIDEFGWQKSLLINVGDKKGPILDEAVRAARPKLVLELGAYIGYSALRMSRNLADGGRLCSVEFNASNAELARRIIATPGPTIGSPSSWARWATAARPSTAWPASTVSPGARSTSSSSTTPRRFTCRIFSSSWSGASCIAAASWSRTT